MSNRDNRHCPVIYFNAGCASVIFAEYTSGPGSSSHTRRSLSLFAKNREASTCFTRYTSSDYVRFLTRWKSSSVSTALIRSFVTFVFLCHDVSSVCIALSSVCFVTASPTRQLVSSIWTIPTETVSSVLSKGLVFSIFIIVVVVICERRLRVASELSLISHLVLGLSAIIFETLRISLSNCVIKFISFLCSLARESACFFFSGFFDI